MKSISQRASSTSYNLRCLLDEIVQLYVQGHSIYDGIYNLGLWVGVVFLTGALPDDGR